MWNIARTFVALADRRGGMKALTDRSRNGWPSGSGNIWAENLFQAGLKRETKAEAIVTQLLERPLVLIFGAGQSSSSKICRAQDPAPRLRGFGDLVDSPARWPRATPPLLRVHFQVAKPRAAHPADASVREPAAGRLHHQCRHCRNRIHLRAFLPLARPEHPVTRIPCWNWLVVGLGVATIMGRGRVQVTEVDEADLDQVGIVRAGASSMNTLSHPQRHRESAGTIANPPNKPALGPAASIVISTRNHKDELRRAVESALTQQPRRDHRSRRRLDGWDGRDDRLGFSRSHPASHRGFDRLYRAKGIVVRGLPPRRS